MQTDPTPSGPRFLGKYEVLARLDSGGMAEIFLARARGLAGFEKLVVLKRILPHLAAEEEFISMFLDEAKTTVALSHGNIVQVFDMGKGEEGDYFIAMEYVAGKNLRRYLRRALDREKQPIDPPLAAWIASEILRGLDYAHRRTDSAGKPLGIVHRDLSPHNILISYEGEVKVADFGIAKAAGKVVHTETGLIRGKASYMSPEQARADDLDGRSDIFSTGILLYELLTGVTPFEGETSDQILRNLLKGPPPPPSSKRALIPAALDAIVLRALSTTREARYASCDVFLKDLGSYLMGSGTVIGPRDLAARMSSLFAEDIEQERQTMSSLPKSVPAPETAAVRLTNRTPAQPSSNPSRTKDLGENVLLLPWRNAPPWARAFAGIAIGAFLIAGSAWTFRGRPAPSPTPAPTPVAAVSPIATPSLLAIDSPRVIDTAKPKPSPKPSLVAVAPTPVPTAAVAGRGHLNVSADPWAFVYIDNAPVRVDVPPPETVNGQKISATPIQNLETGAGKHLIRVEQWDLDKHTRLLSGEGWVEVPANGNATIQFRAVGDKFVRAER